MTVKDDIDQKKQSLKFFYQMAQEALDAEDLDQAIEITAKGLEEAELKNQSEWAKKFDALNSQVEKAKDRSSLNTSITREDITIIKGVGPTVAEKLRGAGFHTVKSIAEATLTQFTRIPGIGEKTAQKIVEGANVHISRKSLNDFPEENVIEKVPPVRNEIKEEKIINEPQKPTTDKTNLPWFDEKHKIRRSSYSQSTKVEDSKDYLHNLGEEDDFEDDFEAEDISASDNNMPDNYVKMPPLQDSRKQEKVSVHEDRDEVFRAPHAQERHTTQSISSQSMQVSTLQEKLEPSEKKLVIEHLIHTLHGLDFHIVKKVQSLKDLYTNNDLIAVKIIRESESLNLVLILPVKLNMLKGKMKVSNDQVKYIPLNEKSIGNGSSFRLLLNSTITKLGDMYKKMQDDLVNEGKLRAYLRRELKVDISLKKSLAKKNLFFQAGPVQHKIFIEPILVCNNEVGFLEKLVPFPYLKDINLHVIQEQKLPELIMFLEDKYTLLEKYSDQKCSLIAYEDSFNQFLQVGKKISLPFIGLGFILLMLVVFQVVSMLEFVVNIGYALFGVYLTSLAYLYVKFFKTKMEIRTDFETPLHQKQLKLDDTELILIEDDLAPEMTKQFIYECLGKNHDSPFINKLEESHIKERLSEKSKTSSIDTKLIFEEPIEQKRFGTREKVKEKKQVKLPEEDEIIQKYSSFLED